MYISYSKIISKTKKYVFTKIKNQVKISKKKEIKIIDFGIGDPKSPTPNFIIKNLSKLAKNRSTSGYPNYIGENKFRESCANYIKREYNIIINSEKEILSTIGSKEAIFNFPIAFINFNDLAICPTPSYPMYKTSIKFKNAHIYLTPLLEENNFLFNFSSIPKEIAYKAKIIWINYPNSPTGVSAPKEWLKILLSWTKYFKILIAADEGCYNDIYFNNKPTSLLKFQKDRIITFFSLSKRSNMTGYRIGFSAGDRHLISGLKKTKTNIDSGSPHFIQDAAILALRDEKQIAKMRLEYKLKRNIIIDALTLCGLEITTADSTFYIWQKVPKGTNDIKFTKTLIKLGIIVTPSKLIFNQSDIRSPTQNFVRFALVPKIKDVNEAANRIRRDLKISSYTTKK